MLLKKISLTNIKSIEKMSIEFDQNPHGWHVLLGMNGSGKSTILKAISLCFLGERQSYALKENFKDWITRGKDEANIKLELELNEKDDSLGAKYSDQVNFILTILKTGDLKFTYSAGGKEYRNPINPEFGWYSAGFGPYRRLGRIESISLSKVTEGNLESHITLFDSEYALTNGIQWLQNLKFQELEKSDTSNSLEAILAFINNSEFLPEKVSITSVDSKGVRFTDGKHDNLNISQLSDGYKSMFALCIEILRQINGRFRFSELIKRVDGRMVVTAEGVILIDEVDIHLHPQWQSKIGNWFKQYFPNIQFIVSTHSPIICQSADGGKIWKIEHPKSNKVSKEVVGQDYQRMVFGNILDSYSTEIFGEETIVRSEKSKELMSRLAKLNIKSFQGKATTEELKEIKDIKAILPTS